VASRSAMYVHRIQSGTKAGELPVELPTRFEFVVNLRTAEALGIAVAPSVMARADAVIR